MSRTDLMRRVEEIESRQGNPVVAYTAAWIEYMNEVPAYAPPDEEPSEEAKEEKRYDVPEPPVEDGEADPSLVYVPEQHGLEEELGWVKRDELEELPTVQDFVVFDPKRTS